MFYRGDESRYRAKDFISPVRVVLLVGAMLAGCATYHAKPIAPEAMIRSFEARTLESPELRRYIAARLNDDAHLRSPDAWNLTTLTLAAFYYSPELDVARAKSGASQAAIQTAGQRPNPSLLLPLGYTSNAIAGESPYTLGLGLDIPIETAGKRGYRVEQARQLSNAASFHVGDVAWQIRSRLRDQLLTLYAATRKALNLEQQLTTQRQIVEMLDKRLAMGAVSAPEANQARMVLIRHRLDLATVQHQILDARGKMASIIGLPVKALTGINIEFDTFERMYPDMPNDVIRRHAVLNRADVLGALAEYEASQAALQLEIARQYPDIHLGPGYTFDAGAHKYLLPVSAIGLPIFQQNQGPIAEATARRAEAAAGVDALQIQAINDVDRAVRNYRAALKDLRLAESLLLAQQRQVKALQKAFAAGETDRLALALSKNELYMNALAHLEAQTRAQQTIGQLEDAMQRPLSVTDLQFVPDRRSAAQ